MQQYKDDLLASCLHLILVLPKEMVIADINQLIPAIKVIHYLVLVEIIFPVLFPILLQCFNLWDKTFMHKICRGDFDNIAICTKCDSFASQK